MAAAISQELTTSVPITTAAAFSPELASSVPWLQLSSVTVGTCDKCNKIGSLI
jgi:hypothetical protein